MEFYKREQLFLVAMLLNRQESIVISHLKSNAYGNEISPKLGYRAVNARKYVRCVRTFYLFFKSQNIQKKTFSFLWFNESTYYNTWHLNQENTLKRKLVVLCCNTCWFQFKRCSKWPPFTAKQYTILLKLKYWNCLIQSLLKLKYWCIFLCSVRSD